MGMETLQMCLYIIHLVFKDDYIQHRILLEIGPRSAWTPNDLYDITPYAAEDFPELFKVKKAQVHAINIERTFWEKVLILHQEHHRPENSTMPYRYSRHYYDTAMMCRRGIKELALKDIGLCNQVVEFKKKFFARTWARDDLAVIGSFSLLPNQFFLEELQKDYTEMSVMIFGEYLEFALLLQDIKHLEDELNSLR